MARSIPVRICLPTGLLIRPLGVGGSCLPSWVVFYWHCSSPPRWRGRVRLSPNLNSLITTALNSNDLRVRAAGIEVDLAAMNMAKTSESAEHLLAQAEGGELSQRVWALWGLGLLGNRGVEPERL